MAKRVYTRSDVFRLCERLEGLGATRFLDALPNVQSDLRAAAALLRRMLDYSISDESGIQVVTFEIPQDAV
jgi:hypothetical protein